MGCDDQLFFASIIFFFTICANLAPKALVHHPWYRKKFKNYLTFRKALIFFLYYIKHEAKDCSLCLHTKKNNVHWDHDGVQLWRLVTSKFSLVYKKYSKIVCVVHLEMENLLWWFFNNGLYHFSIVVLVLLVCITYWLELGFILVIVDDIKDCSNFLYVSAP
jgi:hypothetical protein